MKKLLLLFITLTILANVSYASFPVTKNNTVLTTNFVIDDGEEGEEPSLIVLILRGLLVLAVLGTALFFIVRTWWRAWKRKVKWVRILTKVILILGGVIALLGIICSFEGCIYNMQ
jgi:uncharacterized membrane protein YciS (DUF1049 family)